VGQTNNLERRIKEHKSKSSRSAKYIRYFSSFDLVYHEKHTTKSKAMRRESQLKRLTKIQKEKIIAENKKGKGYSPYNLNIYNELFYIHAKIELIDKLPNLFAKLDLFNIALHKKITSEIKSDEIKVIELASGRNMDKWKTFMEIDKNRQWKILLTDFDKSLLPNINSIQSTANFKFKTKIHSLFEEFPKLKSEKKQDVVLSTYTFDNLWLKDDLHLIKLNNSWYYKLYKIESDIKTIKRGKKLDKQFFKNLKIKTKREKIDLSTLKYGKYIEKYFENNEKVNVNYPGGLITKVLNSFQNQLKKDGLFITADIATSDPIKGEVGYKSVNGTIKIKVENYDLAKYILEKLGFSVRLYNLHDFIKKTGIETPVDIFDHFVLLVRSKGKKTLRSGN